ncbi:hypothetical protein H5410_014710 [Solanum commersonii]|uniref:Uncharacterized protein n=1 Tax=Solanum commersonii TaxID=4109 RepID=A0A9J5ZRQ2_SOLCO|nr:hypothetical protein H5410_014710 [Solanum commersonii]
MYRFDNEHVLERADMLKSENKVISRVGAVQSHSTIMLGQQACAHQANGVGQRHAPSTKT